MSNAHIPSEVWFPSYSLLRTKKIFDVSTVSFHTAIAEDRLLALDILLELLQDVAWQTRIDLWFMHDGAALHFHFLPLSSGMLRCVYGTMDMTRWMKSMACSFLIDIS